MKRMISMCMATLLLLSMAMVGHGTDYSPDGNTQVYLEVSDRYETSIPPTISFHDILKIGITGKVSSDEVIIYVASANYNTEGTLCLKNGSQKIGYSISSGENTIRTDSFIEDTNFGYPVAELARFRGNTTIDISFGIDDYFTSFASGTYTDELTFRFK